MKMLKNISLSLRVISLFLMLFSSSNNLFSANQQALSPLVENEEQEILNSLVFEEQVGSQFDPILPFQKNLIFFNSCFNTRVDLDFRIIEHTASSLNYIKRSRYIFPSLGVKEVIFPFHVFL